MAELRIESTDLVFGFRPMERVGALRIAPRVPLASVRSVEVVDAPWSILRGLRVGTAIPYLLLLGTMIRRGGNDVVALRGRGAAVVVHLERSSGWQRWICTVDDPDATRRAIASHL
jgi:hypothetical protein